MKMAEIRKYIAVDLGAESGRVILGSVSDSKMAMEEIHRFDNKPIEQFGSLRWDFNNLIKEIKSGIEKAAKAQTSQIWGIGIDSWGVDFGLLDADGKLIENPFCYRDSRTDNMMEKAFELMKKRDIYENTGLQFMQFNTLYQLLAMHQAGSIALAKAVDLLFIADLVAYHLCEKKFAEFSLASTSQLMDTRDGKWSEAIFKNLSLPISIMPKIIKPGKVIGQLTAKIGTQLKCGSVPVIAVASHDTASAIAAVPAENNNWAYLSCGTWSLIGVEIPEPIINDKTFDYEFTNEGGVENTICMLKNIMGLWLLQECKRQWLKEGTDLSYEKITDLASKAKPFAAYIEPDCSDFLSPGEMPKRINNYLSSNGLEPIEDKGQLIRAILESLAIKIRQTIDKIEDITNKNIDCVHMLGGGIQNELLCQFIANATGKKIIAGPIEATAAGNILMQAKATRQIQSLNQIREIVRNSFELKEYLPEDTDLWQQQYEKVT